MILDRIAVAGFFSIRSSTTALTFLVLWVGSTAAAVDFGRDVGPIFAEHCNTCHGAEKKKGGLRLDLRAAALKGGADGAVILPGNSAHSPLFRNVSAAADDDDRMPPKGERLSPQEIGILREWIDAGAKWPDALAGNDEKLDHWAWQPIAAVTPPTTAGNLIDGFIQHKLTAAGLHLSPEADRRTLIRRLSAILHGLPPTPEAVEQFVADSDPLAYEKLVDRMLASTSYGERMARHWLDLAHYADTHGFERDRRRPNAWRYRDYVIQAFNDGKPYDRFLQEQIAGDVLWPDNPDATIATGFLAAGPWDYVGQVEAKSPELRRSARSLDLDDMATQVMTSTMAVTINCARCHDHKLDPISQQEYYQIRAVFAGVTRADREIPAPESGTELAATAVLRDKRAQLDSQIKDLIGNVISLADIVGGGSGHGNGVAGRGIDPRTGEPQTEKFGFLDGIATNRYTPVPNNPLIDGVVIPNGDNNAAVLISSTGLTVTGLPATSAKAWDVIRNGPVNSQHATELGGIDYAADGHTILGIHANAGITFDLDAIRGKQRQRLRLIGKVGYFGAAGAYLADAWIFVDGSKAAEFRQLKRDRGLFEIDIPIAVDQRFLTVMSTDGGNGLSHDQICFTDLQLVPDVAADASSDKRAKLAELRAARHEVEAKLTVQKSPPQVFAIVAEKTMPETKILRRGDAESPAGDPLAPGALSALTMLSPNLGTTSSTEQERRAALAAWITDPQNPLTRRVIVNRLWYWCFGQGIVTTPSDFGYGGGRPSHPELLDWLADELLRQNGSLKAVQRLILTSAAYRQDSRFSDSAHGMAVDAGNQLLWRQNPRRLEAEAVRDTVLAITGKLNSQRGGPGFEDFAYQDAYAPIYTYVTPDKPELWRRSIYRYIVRTTPDRFLTTLDCPDPANMTPRRMTTTTPLQSLALYNNDFMLRQARCFAERLAREAAADSEAQARTAFTLAFSRPPSPAELQLSASFINREGLFAFCRSILNASEFVYVD